MEAFSAKGALAAASYAAPRPHDKQETVATTELPPPQSVTQAESSEATGGAHGKTQAQSDSGVSFAEKVANSEPQMRREFELDPETADLVFKAINEDTGEVIRQVPSEVILKVRAYAHAQDDHSTRETRSGETPSEDAEVSHIDKQA